MKRRDFLKKGFYGSFVIASGSTLFASCSDSEDQNDVEPSDGNGDNNNGSDTISIDLSTSEYEGLKTTGEYAYYNDIIIINTGNGYIALSKVCTHQSCTVAYQHNNTQIACPCHGSTFELDGAVKTGPAETALAVYTVSQNGDILTIE